ncbi:segregation and condensation protein A [Acetonema longum]|uniref:Segregation and condensation protein A n=1 Tax=Acetonema longum DSM 6540 TaxID=1009370 RepID=F7NK12_9FIRM|nr:segregation/condensation protein A [Acetonema longum]EGO63659.1 chromosome segregation and condensation protein ScpA [Acetonema longum DSM 6540]
MSDYKIRLEVYEGPLALLLHLIEKDQIDIYDIPIVQVTEQYIAYLKALQDFNIEIASEFLVLAATLLQIKSRMLLPKQAKADVEEEELDDPRRELVERLLEYRRYKEAAGQLELKRQEREQFFVRSPQFFSPIVNLPVGLTVEDLLQALAAVWESTIPEFALISREEISVQEKMADIIYLLQKNDGRIEFEATLIRSHSRSELIAGFMALLELVRLKRVAIQQLEAFGPIYLMLRSESD